MSDQRLFSCGQIEMKYLPESIQKREGCLNSSTANRANRFKNAHFNLESCDSSKPGKLVTCLHHLKLGCKILLWNCGRIHNFSVYSHNNSSLAKGYYR